MDAGLQTMLTHSDSLAWVHLQRVMVSAAKATLLHPGSPMTPGRQAAANLYATAERRAQRHPGSLVAAAELRQAARAHHQAQGAHQAGKVRQVFAEVQGVRPAERLNAVYRYLRRRRRAGGPRPQGVTIRDWEAEVQRLAVGEQPPLLEEELEDGGPALAPAPTADQVRGYLSGMGTRTAPGPDGLPVELFQQASGLFLHHFARVLERAWEEGRFPAGWLTSAQHPIPKVARPRTTEDYRTISLCTVVYKVLAAHVLHLLQQVIPAIPFYQAGFRAQRSTADHLYVLRAVMDECWHVGRPLHVVSLDIKAAFPSVAKGKVVEVLQGYGVPHKLINRVIQLALTDLTFLRWAASSTSTVVRGQGLRQGCPLSPWLFTLVLHGAVGAVVARLPRFSLQQTNPQVFPAVLAYADDLLLLSDRFPDVDEFVVHLVRELALLHLQLNPRKCEYLLRWPGWEDPDPLPRPIRIGGLEMQQVESLLYLGAFISSHLSRQGGVRHRVHRAQRTVAALLPTLREHTLPYAVLERLHATTILPAMAYELSTASDTQRSRATLRRENDVLLQAVLDTGRRPHLPPPGVRRPQAVSVVRAVRKARISYLGHIRRRPPGYPLTIASRLDLGRKKVGRPCFTFSTSVAKDMARLPEPPGGWGGLLRDRRGLQGYLKGAVEEMDSSEDEVLRPGVRRFRQGLELPHQGEGELSGSE
ncbi:Transposon TX1 uncharacterized 149 kDa protein [Frankliniella fusca]|uniref:Transposon TX1 uncharacterized 149 kDa protein n=1 Tax=Frankliniella fusca TaxID=407009 RepID=A0AAE1LNK5_9NEOP|nr:Transposon TX1 uncharacterized 149 kDa protein [Frankliniella fusca]